MGALRQRAPPVKRLMRAIESELFQTPAGWDVRSRYRTEHLWLRYPPPHKPVPSTFERLYQKLFRYYPEAKLEPLRLSGLRGGLAHEFVTRQAKLMEEGNSETDAFTKVEMDLQSKFDALTIERSSHSVMAGVQAGEEKALRAALQGLARRRLELAKQQSAL